MSPPWLRKKHMSNVKLKTKVSWIDQVYQANHSAKVAILFRRNVPFNHLSVAEPEGGFLIVSGSLNSIPITPVNVYGPNLDSPLFFQKVCNTPFYLLKLSRFAVLLSCLVYFDSIRSCVSCVLSLSSLHSLSVRFV